MAEMNFGGVIETVVTSKEFSLEKAREVLKDEVIAVIGYGVQGPGQACNLRDNGFNVIVGQRRLLPTDGYLVRRYSLSRRPLRRVPFFACCSLMLARCSSGPLSRNI